MADAIRISGRGRRWPHCTSNLTTPTHDSTYVSILIYFLFINRKLNMKKWLHFLKSPTCVSNPYILHSVRNLQIQFWFTWNFPWKFRTSLKKCPPGFVTLSLELLKLWWIHFKWGVFFLAHRLDFYIFIYLYLCLSMCISICLYLYLSMFIYLHLYIDLYLFIVISNECAIILKCPIL